MRFPKTLFYEIKDGMVIRGYITQEMIDDVESIMNEIDWPDSIPPE